jgi:peptide deformylase
MLARRIVQLGDPLLRQVSVRIREHEDTRDLFQDLKATLHEFRRIHGFGRGISAIQIGDARRAIYMEVDGISYSIVNPEFEWMSPETFTMWDDCFSFPNVLVRLQRSTQIRVRYTGQSGDTRILEASGGLSELLQHEIDHLDGILAIDRALDRDSFATREEYGRRYAAGSLTPTD